ncbi:MAG TPA: hypothetical protein VMW20_07030 [Candidatus Nanoarchaeia archaeon]|nr:hypothetical protein [Candidatus Nanoarchaeia archaeon]
MAISTARKRLESIERNVLPSMFMGLIIKNDKWFKKTLEETLPALEIKAITLASECKEKGECNEDEPFCDETRIRNLFKETRSKLEKEHLTRQ